jgi:hypothetical protein
MSAAITRRSRIYNIMDKHSNPSSALCLKSGTINTNKTGARDIQTMDHGDTAVSKERDMHCTVARVKASCPAQRTLYTKWLLRSDPSPRVVPCGYKCLTRHFDLLPCPVFTHAHIQSILELSRWASHAHNSCLVPQCRDVENDTHSYLEDRVSVRSLNLKQHSRTFPKGGYVPMLQECDTPLPSESIHY